MRVAGTPVVISFSDWRLGADMYAGARTGNASTTVRICAQQMPLGWFGQHSSGAHGFAPNRSICLFRAVRHRIRLLDHPVGNSNKDEQTQENERDPENATGTRRLLTCHNNNWDARRCARERPPDKSREPATVAGCGNKYLVIETRENFPGWIKDYENNVPEALTKLSA